MDIIMSFFNKSGDSILEDYSYFKGLLTIYLNLTEPERKIKIRIKTDDISFNSFYLLKEEELYRTCRVEIKEISKVLLLENGIYVPNPVFGKLMKESRLKYNLAYGKKQTELKYIFSLIGYDNLVSCLFSDMDCIEVG